MLRPSPDSPQAAAGLALSVNLRPALKLALQVEPQSIPAGEANHSTARITRSQIPKVWVKEPRSSTNAVPYWRFRYVLSREQPEVVP